MGRHGHDRAGAVGGEHVVRDPHRDALVRDRVDRRAPGEHAGLRLALRLPVDLAHARRRGLVGLDLGPARVGGQPRHQRVLRGQHHEGRAPQRVRAGREHLDRAGLGLERDLRALGAADPVRLHRLDLVGPVEALEVEQLVGVVGDLEVPLRHEPALDQRARAVAAAVDDLLVGEHGLIDRVPVDHALLAVGEAALEHAQEHPLVPAVVLRVAGDDLLRPVEHRAHLLELPFHALDTLVRQRHRVDLLALARRADGSVLGRQPEGVEAHGEEHVVAAHAAVARGGVGGRLGVPVPHVQVTRRVGVHRQEVVLRPRAVVEVDGVQALVLPGLAPARLEGLRVVAAGPIVPIGSIVRIGAVADRGRVVARLGGGMIHDSRSLPPGRGAGGGRPVPAAARH